MGNNTVKLMENNIINALLPAVLSKQKKALRSKKVLPGAKKRSREQKKVLPGAPEPSTFAERVIFAMY